MGCTHQKWGLLPCVGRFLGRGEVHKLPRIGSKGQDYLASFFNAKAPARIAIRAGAGGREYRMKPGKAAARPTFPGLVSREDISAVGTIEVVSTSLRCGMLQQALSRSSAAEEHRLLPKRCSSQRRLCGLPSTNSDRRMVTDSGASSPNRTCRPSTATTVR